MRNQIVRHTLALTLSTLLISPVFAVQMDRQAVSSTGSISMSSPSLELRCTAGQPVVGSQLSPGLLCIIGFWQDFGVGGSVSCCVDHVGDANGSGSDAPTIGDVSILIDAKFITGSCDGKISCMTEADINQSGLIEATCNDLTIGDISMLIDYLFITGPETFGPLPTCL
jgi:hypothetical protein